MTANNPTPDAPGLPVTDGALRDLIDWHKRDGTKKGVLTHSALVELLSARQSRPLPSDWVAVPDGWLRACDEEMVGAHLGVADASDDYATAKKKLHDLITWHVQVATDPAVNGGFVLIPREPTPEMVAAFSDPDLPGDGDWCRECWAAMLAAAPSAPAEGGEDFSCCGGNDETPKLHCMDCPRTAPEPMAQGESDFVSPYPVAPMGHGLVTIGEGHINGVRALIFGNRGSGVFGEEGQGNRRMEDGETICAITFATPESVELLRLYVNAIADSFDVPDSLEHPRPPLQFPPTPPQPSASVSERARELQGLIDRYWDLAYAEGKEGRTHDTEEGDASLCRYEIEKSIRALEQALTQQRVAASYDAGMAMHWIERYAAGIDEECQLDRIAEAFTTPQPSADAVRELANSWAQRGKDLHSNGFDIRGSERRKCADELESLLGRGGK